MEGWLESLDFLQQKATLTAPQLLLIQSVLTFQGLNNDTSRKHTKKTTSTTKNNTPKQKKALKSIPKDRARCYSYRESKKRGEMELRLKRDNYQKICVNKETMSFICIN